MIVAGILASVFLAADVSGKTPDECRLRPGEPSDFVEYGETDVLQCFRSPDGAFFVSAYNGDLQLVTASEAIPVGTVDGGHILWRPDGSGFSVIDNEGSGQTGNFRYVDVRALPPDVRIDLRESAVARFAAISGCVGGGWYANTWMEGWLPNGQARLVVQDGIHSEGCGTSRTIGVIGDPITGHSSRVLSDEELRREWCAPARHLEFGYCYHERAPAAARAR